MSYNDERLGEAVRSVVDEAISEIDFTDHIDMPHEVTEALSGSSVHDLFDMREYVHVDDIGDHIAAYLGQDFTLNDLAELSTRVAAIERVFAHMHGAMQHLAHIASQVNTHTDNPEA